ncbi:unnamed protein product [Fusarium fujikuroi]|nr:unnamed protein product [Fusarium fujikuroi]
MKPASKRTGSECATSSSTPRHLRLSLSQVFGRAKAAESRTESGSSLPPSYGSYAGVHVLGRALPRALESRWLELS